MDKPGYHLREIKKGKLGEVSKIREELEEVEDAVSQDAKIMTLIELADLFGAIRAFLEKYYPGISIRDLEVMSNITDRAFINGHRG